jgi:enamine deaminase RidA (YjgF/YER057c/UK114 family)
MTGMRSIDLENKPPGAHRQLRDGTARRWQPEEPFSTISWRITTMSKRFRLETPATMPKSVGYSQLATAGAGELVFIAGQVALDRSGNLVGENDFRAQVRQVFENLQAAMAAAGGSFTDVLKLNSYFVDLAHLPVFREVRDTYIDVSNPPASTAVQVSSLFRREFLIEIEAVGVVQKRIDGK